MGAGVGQEMVGVTMGVTGGSTTNCTVAEAGW